MAFQQNQVQNFTPQQLQVLQQFLQQGSQGLGQNTFAPYAQKARENFASQTVPLLAERFGGQGDERGSSALNSQLLGAGQDFESTLSALGAQHDQQLYALLAQLGLSPQFGTTLEEEEPGWGKTLLQGGINAAPELLGLLGAGVGSIVPGLGTAAGGALGTAVGAGIKGGFGTTSSQPQQQQQQKPWWESLPASAVQNSQLGSSPVAQSMGAYNPAQFNPNVVGSYFSQLNKFNQNPMPRLA